MVMIHKATLEIEVKSMEPCSFILAENLTFILLILENIFHKDSPHVVYRLGNKYLFTKGIIWPAKSGEHENEY